MAEVKATMNNFSFDNNNQFFSDFEGTEQLDFYIWNGMPQRPQRVIDIFRRLGGKRQRIQALGYEAAPSSSTAEYWPTDDEDATTHINSMMSLKGIRCDLTYYSETFNNVLILDVSYNKRNERTTRGESIIYYNITYMVDGAADE